MNQNGKPIDPDMTHFGETPSDVLLRVHAEAARIAGDDAMCDLKVTVERCHHCERPAVRYVFGYAKSATTIAAALESFKQLVADRRRNDTKAVSRIGQPVAVGCEKVACGDF